MVVFIYSENWFWSTDPIFKGLRCEEFLTLFYTKKSKKFKIFASNVPINNQMTLMRQKLKQFYFIARPPEFCILSRHLALARQCKDS